MTGSEEAILVISRKPPAASCLARDPELIVVGWDSQSKTREQAVEQQIVDYVANDFETGAGQADVILLAVPVSFAT